MPGVRRISTQSVALTCWTWPITMSFPLAFVERRKCGIGRSSLSVIVTDNSCCSRGNPICKFPMSTI
eukprot:1676499-Prorocentrum_lima.AAC.1